MQLGIRGIYSATFSSPKRLPLILGIIAVGLASLLVTPTQLAQAQSTQFASTETQFHDLFITAGYSTAFGAALGAAVIGLTAQPEENLHFVAIGASLGFITGSLLGTYILVSPTFVTSTAPYGQVPKTHYRDNSRQTIGFHPVIRNGEINGLMTSIALRTF